MTVNYHKNEAEKMLHVLRDNTIFKIDLSQIDGDYNIADLLAQDGEEIEVVENSMDELINKTPAAQAAAAPAAEGE